MTHTDPTHLFVVQCFRDVWPRLSARTKRKYALKHLLLSLWEFQPGKRIGKP